MRLPNLTLVAVTAAAVAMMNLWPVVPPSARTAPDRPVILYHIAANESVSAAAPEGGLAPPSGSGPNRQFWVAAGRRGEYREVSATLLGQTDTFRVWAQDSTAVSANLMLRAAREAESAVESGLLAALAQRAVEKRPDLLPVDLVYAELSAMGGYFSSADQPGERVHPYSNNTSAIYVSLASCSTSAGCSVALIRHELQHLLQYAVDPLEETWFNEGLSELAEASDAPAPLACTDFELFGWSSDPDLSGLHYDGAEAFLEHWRRTLGEEALYSVALDPRPGREALSGYLAYHGAGRTLDDVFLDWAAEQVSARLSVESDEAAGATSCPNTAHHTLSEAAAVGDSVSQYGCDVIRVPERWEGEVQFAGSPYTDLLPEFPPNSSLVWWSGNGHTNHSTLTASIDLGGLERPALRFWVWHEIEEWYDWAYLAVSFDQGATWQSLAAPAMTTKDPFGNSPGVGYTGSSEAWLQQEIDLSDRSGEQMLVRFGYLTDDAVEATGFALNRVEVIDGGTGTSAEYLRWQSDGFRPLSSWTPQRQDYAVIALDTGDPAGYRVLPLGAGNRGRWEIAGADTEALLVCGLTADALPTAYEVSGIARPDQPR